MKRLISLAHRCTNLRQLKPIHASFITTGLSLNTIASTNLIAFSALSGSLDLIHYASLLFTHLEKPSSSLFNALIRAYSRSSDPISALRHFKLMSNSASHGLVDHFTFNFVLLACVNGGLAIEGKVIHCWVVKNGLALFDCHVQTAVIRFYVMCKEMECARKVFDEIPLRDVFHCNALMDGYVRCGLASEALDIFENMIGFGVEPDEHCATTAIKACAHMGVLSRGNWIHEYVKKRKGFDSCVFVATALVDMYGKCGCLDTAIEVFEKISKKNVFSWAAMVGAFAVHGHAKSAIHCLERMQLEDAIKPDSIVLLGALTACTHAGFQKEGCLLFDNMECQYGVSSKHEHYSCVVDLLSRAGKLSEGYELIRKMPMKPLASTWGALLSGCRIHNEVDLAEIAVKEIELLENEDKAYRDGAYVQLSNIYLAARRSEDAIRVRKMIGDGGASKTPGWSMIEVDGKVNEFVSGDSSHKHRARISAVLDLMFSNPIRDKSTEWSRDFDLYG